ncbi:MAG: TlpA family protein disulfide reductase [Sediminibacterium magnilacihabitans]|jgi:thiol-disulfide isomerase/thioredoxin|nr:TlpA family protein disulfide reductase [Sediminibacterium magnilacihabitans]PQV56483.1 thiol-disulfide isomerase/thioredoxin [Sediminibacterium magnilacihabitans]
MRNFCLLLLLCPWQSQAQTNYLPRTLSGTIHSAATPFQLLADVRMSPVKGKRPGSVNELGPFKLTAGDTIPDALWHQTLQVVNHPQGKKTIRLADYKGKLIILDFWATWCGACIKAMPRIHALQTVFQHDMVVLPVTDEPYHTIARFLQTNAIFKEINTVSIVNDTVLRRYFPHITVPHFIWISPKGRFLAPTGSDEINAANIKAALGETANGITNKVDLDGNKPLFFDNNIELDSNSFYSIFYKGRYIGLPSGNRFRRTGEVLRGRAVTNQEILELYEAAVYPLFEKAGLTYNRKLLILTVKDTAAVYARLSNARSEARNFYNYDLIVPVRDARNLFAYVLQDLNRYSAYHGSIETKRVPCFIIQKSGASVKTSAAGVAIEKVVKILNQSEAVKLPVVNASGFSGKLDLPLHEPLDFKLIKNKLQAYGLEIVTGKRPMRVFVLADKDAQ